jgi:hypothetical protein
MGHRRRPSSIVVDVLSNVAIGDDFSARAVEASRTGEGAFLAPPVPAEGLSLVLPSPRHCWRALNGSRRGGLWPPRSAPELLAWPPEILALAEEVRRLARRLESAQARRDFAAAQRIGARLRERTRQLEAAKARLMPDQDSPPSYRVPGRPPLRGARHA